MPRCLIPRAITSKISANPTTRLSMSPITTLRYAKSPAGHGSGGGGGGGGGSGSGSGTFLALTLDTIG